MKNYMLRYLVQIIPVLLGVTFLTFALLYLAPEDPAIVKLTAQGIPVSKEVLNRTREEMGLNQPFLIQYGTWLIHFLQGDMGTSYKDDIKVADKLMAALPTTVILTVASMTITLIVSIPLGIFTAVRKNRLSDYSIRFLTFIGNAIPNFLLAFFLLYFFALKWKWLPVLANGSFKGYILPTLSLSTVMISKYIRQIRGGVLEELKKGYVLGARSRGVKENVILFKNVLQNSMISVVTLIGLSIGSLLGGTAIVETIFQCPGLGKLVIESVIARDYPVVQGFVVWMAVTYVIIHMLTDISYWLFNPKIREVVRRNH